MLGDDPLHGVHRNGLHGGLDEVVAQEVLGLGNIRHLSRQLCVAEDLLQAALQVTDVGLHVFGDVADDLIRKILSQQFELFLQYCAPGLELRRGHVNRGPAAYAAPEPLFQSLELVERPVTGKDHLGVVALEPVKGVEHGFLQGRLSEEKVDVVQQEHIVTPVFFGEFVRNIALDGGAELVHEVLRRRIAYLELFRVMLPDVVADRLHQVGFAQSASAVKEEGIEELCLAGVLGDGEAGGVCVVVVVALDEAVKSEFLAEQGMGTTPAGPLCCCLVIRAAGIEVLPCGW